MNNVVSATIIAEILAICANTSSNRRKIFEQNKIVLKVCDYFKKALSLRVILFI